MKNGIQVVAAMVAGSKGFEQMEIINKALMEGFKIEEIAEAMEALKANN